MIKLIRDKISREELRVMAQEGYGDLVKAVVDIKQGIMTVGGDLHADEETFLLEQGSRQEDLWGINIYPDRSGDEWIEFDSMINLRPWQGNRTRGVENIETQERIRNLVQSLVT